MTTTISFTILEHILVALLVTLASGWISIKIAKRLSLVDIPGSEPHKKHALPTPIAGGLTLAIVLPILGLYSRIYQNSELLAILLGGIIILGVGLWDDLKGLSPLSKLIGQGIAVVVLIWMGVYIRIFESPEFFIHGEGGIYVLLDWLLTALWIIGITNAFNFVDSMDGLAAALAGIAAAFLMLVSLDSNQPTLSILNANLLGVCIALYFYNAPPARMFLGDAGAQTLGFWLASLAIIYTPVDTFQTSSWFVPILILGVPIFDMTLVVLSRLRRRHPFYQSSLDHTYHRLVHLGFESNRAVLMMHIAALSLGCIAFIALNFQPLLANTVFAIILGLGLVTLLILDSKRYWG